jgi:AraC-like DNA-binding protein
VAPIADDIPFFLKGIFRGSFHGLGWGRGMDVTEQVSCYSVPTFTYAGPPEGQNYEAWREEFCRRFCLLDAETGTAERINCTIEISQVGPLSFGTAYGSSGSFLRTRSLLSDGHDDLVLLTAIKGDALAVQRGSIIELRPSEMCITSLDHIGESRLSRGGRYTALRMPRRDLMAISKNIEDKIARPLEGSPALKNFIRDYYALCAGTAPGLDLTSQHAMARHMVELVALMVETGGDVACSTSGNGYGAASLQLIQAQVREHLHDCGLSIASVALRARVSPKQVQRLFQQTGSTFSEFVLEQRLLLAYRRLSAPGTRGEKISTIAFDTGFGDLSYFNRSFRKRFGMTPSEWRENQVVA